jgi:hypothetical protein
MKRITKEQQFAIRRLYDRDQSVAKNYRAFRKMVVNRYDLGCLLVRWKSMWVGIEDDGYTHS